MKKTFYSLLPAMFTVAALMVTLNGCSLLNAPNGTLREASLQPSLPQQNKPSSLSSSQADSELPFVELKEPGVITVYRTYQYTDIFEPVRIEVDQTDLTVPDIIREAEKVLDVELPIIEVTEDKGRITVNLSHDFTDKYDKRDERELDAILDTVGMTLRENVKSFNRLSYQIDGVAGPLNQWYELPVLKLIDGTPGEYAAIRAKIPYEGLDAIQEITEYDAVGNQIATFLSRLMPLDRDIASVKELDNQYILQTAIFQTKYYFSTLIKGEEERYRAELKPIEGPVSGKLQKNGPIEIQYWLQEHLEQSAKLIFGEDVAITHENLYHYKFKYFEIEGVYTPPHTEVGPNPRAFLLDYEDLGDSYRVKAVYVLEHLGYDPPYSDPDTKEGFYEDELKNYVQTKGRKREIILRKAEGGTLQFVSHRFLSQ